MTCSCSNCQSHRYQVPQQHHHTGHHAGQCCPCCPCGSSCSCKQGSVEHHHGDFAKELLRMADDAWMDLLKEKIKEEINSRTGKDLDKLAKLVSDSNHERWKHKLERSKVCDSYEAKIAHFFGKD